MPNIPIYHVDAFTATPFGGNPAAVCITDEPLPDYLMANIAREINLPETAFIYPLSEAIYRIRWFTPTTEVKLCGHATLATAHVLFEQNFVQQPLVTFHTKDNALVLTAAQSSNGVTLDFPADFPQPWDSPHQHALLSYLGLPHNCPVLQGPITGQLLIIAPSPDVVYQLHPNFSRLNNIEAPLTGVAVSAAAERYDFISRFFDPWQGIDEDPVTGSAHTLMTPYWAAVLGKNQLFARQASPRGGELHVELADQRVLITGQAVTVFKGQLTI